VLFQALNDVGFPPAANAACRRVGEVMQKKDFKDPGEVPEAVAAASAMAARNAAERMAELLLPHLPPSSNGPGLPFPKGRNPCASQYCP
jgi:hypothetical protein